MIGGLDHDLSEKKAGVFLVVLVNTGPKGVATINSEARQARSAEPFSLGFPRKKILSISDRIRG